MAAQVEFTERWLRNLKPDASGKQLEFYDLKLKNGFGVRIGRRSKTFFIVYRSGGRKVRYTLGRYPLVSLSDARKSALKVNANDLDPAAAAAKVHGIVTLGDLGEKFLVAKRSHLRASTLREYERILVKEIGPVFGADRISKVTRARVREWLGAKGSEHPYASNRNRSVLHAVFAWGISNDWLESNPVIGLRKEKEFSRERVLTPDEIRAIWGALALERPLIAAFVKLLFYTGVRRSEALTAQWKDVSSEEKLWRQPRTATKSVRPHDVPLSEPAVQLLESVRLWTGHLEHVFAGPTKRPISATSKLKARLDDNAGVTGWRIHDIRRTVASNLPALGVRKDVVAEVLGHSLGGVTSVYERYSYLPEKRDALDRWAEHLHGLVAPKVSDSSSR